MPRQRPAASGYARLAQDEEERGLDSADEDIVNATTPLSATSTRYAAIQPGPREGIRTPATYVPARKTRTRRTSSGVDIKAINARLERWAQEIADKFKIRKKDKSQDDEKLEIQHTVFQAPEGVRPATAEMLAYEPPPPPGKQRMSKEEYDDIVESVRVAIEMGVHPKLITKGSSGSYFARNTEGKVVGVFKPKDEEPYASRNPKWTKWVHRNLFPCCFGRACLIPNLSYVSEAAAYVLDRRLRTDIVPATEVVYLSSKSFYYDYWERWNARRKGLPAKPGSFQVFLKGYKDATEFLRENPWPDQNTADFPDAITNKKKRRPLANCMPSGPQSDDDEEAQVVSPPPQQEHPDQSFRWSKSTKQSFREELEKLVILDYIMRNTDRGLDNWMIKVDWQTEEVSIKVEPRKPETHDRYTDSEPRPNRPVSLSPQRPASNTSRPYRRHEAMTADSRPGTPSHAKDAKAPAMYIGAIDNSLSWPWKHPDAWRSFPFGWLFLPVSLIGQPFSQKTRDHFLPLLTSTLWWGETQLALRKVFSMDSDFKESMFERQIAVMKGQAWNVVETLKQKDHGPLELTRRTRVCVWDDLVDVPVAMPLGKASTDIRRNPNVSFEEEEEMDIGAANSQSPTQDLLGSPTSELPNPHRFELTRDESSADLGHGGDEESSSAAAVKSIDFADSNAKVARDNLSTSLPQPPRPSPSSRPRLSFEFPRYSPKTPRRPRSSSTRSGSRPFVQYDGDDLEGDLGYAAASDMEGNRRKVIVERLEAVKSKNPVFTWC